MKNKTELILSAEDIHQKINRIAYQVAEDNYDEQELFIIGIKDNGWDVAQKIAAQVKKIVKIKTEVGFISVNKHKPTRDEIELSFDRKELNNKVIILVDDVANTGRTMLYAMKPLLEYLPKKIQIAVLVDRQHKKFPVCADFVGISLSTTMKEHVSVVMETEEEGVYLS